MSIMVTASAACGNCGAEQQVRSAASVNADRRPDLRAAILNGSFQATVCASCGGPLRLPAHMTFLHMAAGQWILVDGPERLDAWPEAEAEAAAAYASNFGEDASEAAQELGRDLRPRLVFGWPALREKLLAAELGLDDVSLECVKMALLRGVEDAPIEDGTELRLIGGDEEVLRFEWLVSTTEAWVSRLDVERDTYEEVAANVEGWKELRGELAGLFVDLGRMTRGQTDPR